MSRHVQFYEHIFPYQVFNPTSTKQTPLQMNVGDDIDPNNWDEFISDDTLDPPTEPQTPHPPQTAFAQPVVPPSSKALF